jgi:signal transduction histidine kinase
MTSSTSPKSYLKTVYGKISLGSKQTTLGYGIALLLLLILGIVSYQNAVQLRQTATEIQRTQQAFLLLTNISAILIDAESAQPGYFLLDDPADLDEQERDRTADEFLQQQITALRPLLNTTSAQQKLNRMESLVKQRLEVINQMKVSLPAPQSRQFTQQIQQNRQEVRRLLDGLRVEESDLVKTYLEESQGNLRSRMLLEQWGALLTFVVLLSVYASLHRQRARREQAEAKFRVASQQKALTELKLQFFSMVSHEFRTPLSLITGSAQLLNESLKSSVEPSKLKNLFRIQSAGKLMSQMLNDLLFVARADAGKLDFNPTIIELQSFCLNLVEDMQMFSSTQREIRFIHQGQLTHARLDEKLLYSILSNLLANAIKYSQPETPIDFRLIDGENHVIFQVQDQGIGITPDDLTALYEPFSRGSNIQGTTGTGLGLTVVKSCVELQGGDISVESTIGVGTKFTVMIPQ